jgi:hypothetical protein
MASPKEFDWFEDETVRPTTDPTRLFVLIYSFKTSSEGLDNLIRFPTLSGVTFIAFLIDILTKIRYYL